MADKNTGICLQIVCQCPIFRQIGTKIKLVGKVCSFLQILMAIFHDKTCLIELLSVNSEFAA